MELTVKHLVILNLVAILITLCTIIFGSGKWKGKIETIVSEIKKDLETLTKRVDKIYEVFFERGLGKTLESQSPIKLNQLGREIADELDLDSIADIHTLALKAQAENLNPYEIQQLCFRYAQNDLADELQDKAPEQFKAISLTAFNKGIPREDVLKIIGVLLRDRILKLMGYADADLKL